MLQISNKRQLLGVAVLHMFVGLFYLPLSLPFRLFRKKIILGEAKRILIIDAGFLGDTILTLPALNAIKQHAPHARITVLAHPVFGEIIKSNTSVDEIIPVELPWLSHKKGAWKAYWSLLSKLREEKYDIAIDFRGDLRDILFLCWLSGAKRRIGSGITGFGYMLTDDVKLRNSHEFLRMNALAEALGAKVEQQQPTITVKTEVENAVKAMLKGYDLTLLIAVCPGAAYHSKAWPLQRWIQLINTLTEEMPATVMILGGADDTELLKIEPLLKHQPIMLVGKTTLDESAAALNKSALVIGNDTGLMHMAAALGKNTITLFGPTDPHRWRAYGEKSYIISKNMKCCAQGPLHNCKHNRATMEAISVEDMMEKVKEILNLKQPKR
ncbi:glycosyltransferase family 9 protein [Candidatus Woesearchaeota archaeon]|nr:glycosyltransferase family 9 protein [Candidatus Woesearchaeota archaeon]